MSTLGRKAVSGVLWTTGLNVFRDFVQFGVMLVLVRLIAPESYGEFSLVTAILGFLSVFSYRVFLEHTLQIRPGGEVNYQIYFTAGAVVQVVLFLGTNVAAEILKHLGRYAAVAGPVHVMSLVFLLELGHEFRVKMLERAMDWKRLRMMEGIGVMANAGLALVMAAAGAGVYALLVPSLLLSIPAIVDLLWIQRWRPTWQWDVHVFRPAREYGLIRLTSVLLLWSKQLLESTVLVKLVGFALYGIYGRALGLAALCCLKVPSLLSQSLFPVLTKLDPGSGSSTRAATLVLCSVAWTTFPAAVIFSVLASPVVHTLYGARWVSAIPFLPWAMAAGTAAALAQTGSLLMVANLQQKISLWIDGVTLTGTALGLWLLAPRSLTLYLIGTASIQGVAFLLMMAWLYRRHAVDLAGITRSLLPPAACVGLSYLLLELARTSLGLSRESLAGAVAYGAAFCLLYVFLLRLSSGRQCREVVSFLPGRSYLERWLLLGT